MVDLTVALHHFTTQALAGFLILAAAVHALRLALSFCRWIATQLIEDLLGIMKEIYRWSHLITVTVQHCRAIFAAYPRRRVGSIRIIISSRVERLRPPEGRRPTTARN